ncbi:MAG: Sec-independent protein translocase protein TatB [Myxococcota bacterium]|nr:Sec-independent protein translocase protein TatB [Myxococcota bacterium]
MFGIGWTEFILVALVLLIFVGPKHFPAMLRKFGKVVADLRSASRELRSQIELEVEDLESPSDIIKGIGRDIEQNMPSPYDDIRSEADAVKQEIEAVKETFNKDTSKPTSEDPAVEATDTRQKHTQQPPAPPEEKDRD